MKMVKVILSFSILFSFISCEKKEKLIGRFEMLKLAQKIDPTVKPVLADDLNSGPRCKGKDGTLFYGKGCIRAIPVQVGILNMICVEFMSYKDAYNEAKRLKQWYYKNWLFDEVEGEPFLEKFLKKAYNANSPPK